MLTNKKSNKNRKWLYLLIIPVIGVSVMSFQQPVEEVISKSSLIEIDKNSSALVSVMSEGGDIPSRFPLDKKSISKVSLNYGWEGKNPVTGEKMKHKGIDLKAETGTPVYSTANGVVAKSTETKAYGKVILIKHKDGYSTLYAHLDELLIDADVKVKIGDKIGTVGNTGYSTGPHLHYEVMKNGENVDPADYF